MQAAARAIGWTDQELLNMPTYGGNDYSADKPPVSWFAPHSVSVYKRCGLLRECAQGNPDRIDGGTFGLRAHCSLQGGTRCSHTKTTAAEKIYNHMKRVRS